MRKLLALILLVALPLGAAYDFSGPTSDDAIITNLTTHNDQRSYGLWVFREGDGEGNLGRMFDKRDNQAEVEFFFIFGVTSTYNFKRVFSDTAGEWSIPEPSLNAWHRILITYDSSDVANNPTIDVDGVSQTVTVVITPVGTANTNTSAYILGNRNHPTSGFNRSWDGGLGEWAVWNRILASDERTIFESNYSWLFVPDGLFRYSPLIRELGDRLDNGSQTTNDTPTVIAHPDIIYPTQVLLQFPSAPPAGGVGIIGPIVVSGPVRITE